MKREVTQGFTLVEVLIVIAIVGILTAILIPAILNARRAANDSAAQSYLRNAISLAELSRSNGDHSIEAAGNGGVLCSAQSVWVKEFPQNVQTCHIGQTANGTVGYVTSSTGRSYQFDGNTIFVTSVTELPSLP